MLAESVTAALFTGYRAKLRRFGSAGGGQVGGQEVKVKAGTVLKFALHVMPLFYKLVRRFSLELRSVSSAFGIPASASAGKGGGGGLGRTRGVRQTHLASILTYPSAMLGICDGVDVLVHLEEVLLAGQGLRHRGPVAARK